jgi:hypothetical protein
MEDEKESLKDVPHVEDTDITHPSRGDGLIASTSVIKVDVALRSSGLGAPLSGSTNSLQGSDSAKAAEVTDHRIKPSDSTKGLPGSSRGPRSRDISLSSDRYKDLSHSAKGSTRSRIGNIYKKKGDKIVIGGSRHQVPAPRSDGFELEPEEEATWSDVYRACCCHTGSGWMKISSFLFSLLLLLYFFLVGLDLLGTSFAVVGGCTAGSLLGSDTSPLASVMIGVIATALLHSSSTTTPLLFRWFLVVLMSTKLFTWSWEPM